ncbi:hypothetical protein PoB_000900500 [Plakobranchus ocellatus]|uniref:Uncharacterized protein n=1 Tax=Plakobranchus ocellatus TaxID=259542 RepID=A0AAV3YID5_9GAST|nr:hypothetical protein PoB_000900500 [Plakobranchus ocellatus]
MKPMEIPRGMCLPPCISIISCGTLNKNPAKWFGVMAVAIRTSHVALEQSVTLKQKYLVPGHTLMECDSTHSVINRRLNGAFFSRHDYVLAMQMVRQVPFFNNALEVLFTDSVVEAILEVCASWKTCSRSNSFSCVLLLVHWTIMYNFV